MHRRCISWKHRDGSSAVDVQCRWTLTKESSPSVSNLANTRQVSSTTTAPQDSVAALLRRPAVQANARMMLRQCPKPQNTLKLPPFSQPTKSTATCSTHSMPRVPVVTSALATLAAVQLPRLAWQDVGPVRQKRNTTATLRQRFQAAHSQHLAKQARPRQEPKLVLWEGMSRQVSHGMLWNVLEGSSGEQFGFLRLLTQAMSTPPTQMEY